MSNLNEYINKIEAMNLTNEELINFTARCMAREEIAAKKLHEKYGDEYNAEYNAAIQDAVNQAVASSK